MTLQRTMLVFAAGALGGLANSLVVWLAGISGITTAAGADIAPTLTPAWLYSRLVWGGIWGILFLSPWPLAATWQRGLLFSLAPSLVQLLVVFPAKTEAGLFGLGLGGATPFFVLAFNAVWGLVAAWSLDRAAGDTRRGQAAAEADRPQDDGGRPPVAYITVPEDELRAMPS